MTLFKCCTNTQLLHAESINAVCGGVRSNMQHATTPTNARQPRNYWNNRKTTARIAERMSTCATKMCRNCAYGCSNSRNNNNNVCQPPTTADVAGVKSATARCNMRSVASCHNMAIAVLASLVVVVVTVAGIYVYVLSACVNMEFA